MLEQVEQWDIKQPGCWKRIWAYIHLPPPAGLLFRYYLDIRCDCNSFMQAGGCSHFYSRVHDDLRHIQIADSVERVIEFKRQVM